MIIKLLLIILLLLPFEAHSFTKFDEIEREARRREFVQVLSIRLIEAEMKLDVHRMFHKIMCDMLAKEDLKVKAVCDGFESYKGVMK